MFNKKDRLKLDKTNEYIDHLNKHYFGDNAYLRSKYDTTLERAVMAERENVELRTKVDLYEKYIQTSLNKNTNMLDTVIMINGELYKLISSTICEEVGDIKTMSAEFQCLTGTFKNFNDSNDSKKEN